MVNIQDYKSNSYTNWFYKEDCPPIKYSLLFYLVKVASTKAGGPISISTLNEYISMGCTWTYSFFF